MSVLERGVRVRKVSVSERCPLRGGLIVQLCTMRCCLFWGEVGIPSNNFDNTYLEADKQINIQDFRPLQTSK